MKNWRQRLIGNNEGGLGGDAYRYTGSGGDRGDGDNDDDEPSIVPTKIVHSSISLIV